MVYSVDESMCVCCLSAHVYNKRLYWYPHKTHLYCISLGPQSVAGLVLTCSDAQNVQ